MSYVSIYKISPTGEVEKFAEARNASAGALHIWHQLAEKYNVVENKYSLLQNEKAINKLWAMFDQTTTPMPDRILLGFTFDRVWVKKENIEKVAVTLDDFWKNGLNCKSYDDYEKAWHDISPTIPQIAAALREAAKDNIRGVCFNQTSVSESAWYIAEKIRCETCEGHCNVDGEECEECGGEGHNVDERMFNFDKDKALNGGKRPWELFDGLQSADLSH